MSWEGYEYIFCENGHKHSVDPYNMDDYVCPKCFGKIIKSCLVDQTNGDDEERKYNEENIRKFEKFIKKFFDKHKDIYVKNIKDELKEREKVIEAQMKEVHKLYEELEKYEISNYDTSIETLKSYVGKSFTGKDGMTILILGYSECHKTFWVMTYEGNVNYYSIKDILKMKVN